MWAYKVLSQGRKSWGHFLPPEFKVTYIKGKWATPNVPGSKLFVFKEFDTAKAWVSIARCEELWEAEVDELVQIPNVAYTMNKQNIIDFWNGHDAIVSPSLENACVCNKVKLIKKIQ